MPKRAADDGEATVSSKKKAKQDEKSSHSQPDGQLSKDGEGNYYLDLGKMKRATVNVFKGKPQVNIREYYADKDSGEAKPGKKGITLNTSQWSALTAAIPALSKQLEAAEVGGVEESSKSKIDSEKVQKAKKPEKSTQKKKKKKKEASEDEDED